MTTAAQYRRRAYYQTRKAIESGVLARIDETTVCVDCDAPAKLYDHLDYKKPLLVEPVCISCNMKRGPASPRPDRANKAKPKKSKPPRVNKDKRFELRLSRQELAALRQMANQRGVTCSELIAAYIQRRAKREGVWDG